MSERIELSFKNKEVRMSFYLAIPTFIIGSLFIFYGEQEYPYIPLLLLVLTWTSFSIWRFYYRRKQNKNLKKHEKLTP